MGNTIGLGMIIRDFKGEIHASSCCNRPYKYQLVIVEVLALKSAMLLCNDLGQIQVIFE